MQLLIQIYLWNVVKDTAPFYTEMSPLLKDGKPQPKEKLDQNNAQEKRHYSLQSTPIASL